LAKRHSCFGRQTNFRNNARQIIDRADPAMSVSGQMGGSP
jgi:hypothetical protein